MAAPGDGRARYARPRAGVVEGRVRRYPHRAAGRPGGRARRDLSPVPRPGPGTRVGIRGWSYGGALAAIAVIRRPDVLHAAVSGAAPHDQRLYDTHWRERFLGLPQRNPEGYDKSSTLTGAASLTRPLLLIHGIADDNVVVAHTLRMSAAAARGRPPAPGPAAVRRDPHADRRRHRQQAAAAPARIPHRVTRRRHPKRRGLATVRGRCRTQATSATHLFRRVPMPAIDVSTTSPGVRRGS